MANGIDNDLRDEEKEQRSSSVSRLTERSEEIDDEGIWYFGYGPIVHPDVRARRKVVVTEAHAAILPDHRLTFCYGGLANIVFRRGYHVQGVLMKVASEEDWERLKSFDSGYYVQEVLNVYPYQKQNEKEQFVRHASPDEDDDEDDLAWEDPADNFQNTKPIRAYTFVMADYEESVLDKPLEKKPQERYLRLIAVGMERHGVDNTYIQDEIMGCPYIPSLEPEDWHVVPQEKESLRTVRFSKYQQICRSAPPTTIYFILNDYILRTTLEDSSQVENPAFQWMKCHMHGKPDATFLIHSLVVDPAIPFAASQADLTPLHFAWVECHTSMFLQQAGLSATKVYRLLPETSDDQKSAPVWRQSLRRSFQRNKGNTK